MTANDVVAPDDFDVLGSNDDTNWSLLGSFTTPNPVVYTRLDQYDINAVTSYLYYAVIIKSHRGSNHTYSGIYTLEYYGVPEYDPDAHGTDVTVKSYPNVPNTDWLEVYYDAKGLATGAVTTVNDLKPSSLGSAINSSSTNNITVADDAFVFNGTDSYIKINDLTNPSGAWIHSVVAWVKFTDFDSSQEVSWIGDADGAAIRQSFSFQTGGETVTMGISGSNVQFRFTSPLSAGKWHHVVYTYNGGQAGSTSTAYQVFIDGVEASKFGGSGSGTLTLPAGSALWFGRNHGGTNHFGGSIANFRLFNRALTSDEIYQLYAYQKEYFGHGDLGMTFKAGRLGIGTSEPRAALDVRGDLVVRGNFHSPGSVVQVVTNPVVGQYAYTVNNAPKEITALRTSFSPKFRDSLVLVQVYLSYEADYNAVIYIKANGYDIPTGQGRSYGSQEGVIPVAFDNNVSSTPNSSTFIVHHILNGESSVEYKIYYHPTGNNTLRLNRAYSTVDEKGMSYVVITEIAQ